MQQRLASWKRWAGMLLIILPGCGGVPLEYNDTVTGTVKLDGVPVPRVLVVFMPQCEGTLNPARNSTGMTDNEGRFTLKCDNQKLGAVIGRHRVIIQIERPKDTRKRSMEEPGVSVPAVYASVTNSPLLFEITMERSVYDLDLNSAAK
jgi:hypothetical protein